MEERVLISLLLDFYGPLLTDKQRMSLQLHHEDDMSLGEIAEELGVSRQAVHDNLQRARHILNDYESKLAFDSLSEKLQEAFQSLKGKGKITEDDVNLALRQVRTALLEADVNFMVAKDFVKSIKEKALGEEVFGSLNPAQTVIKIVNDELTALLGGTQSRIMISSKPPTIIMLVGLQGAGKTTTAGKLAVYLRKQGKHPMLVAADVYRPAAITQLQVVGKQIDIPVFADETPGANPVDIARRAVEQSTHMLKDVVIIDTAGRLAIDEVLMDELSNIKAAVRPHEILLVVDSMIGLR